MLNTTAISFANKCTYSVKKKYKTLEQVKDSKQKTLRDALMATVKEVILRKANNTHNGA